MIKLHNWLLIILINLTVLNNNINLNAYGQQIVLNQQQCLTNISTNTDLKINKAMAKCIEYRNSNQLQKLIDEELNMCFDIGSVAGILDQKTLVNFYRGLISDMVTYCNANPNDNRYYNTCYAYYGYLLQLEPKNPVWNFGEGILAAMRGSYNQAQDCFKYTANLFTKNSNYKAKSINSSMGSWQAENIKEQQQYEQNVADYNANPYTRKYYPGAHYIHIETVPKAVPQKPIPGPAPFSAKQIPSYDTTSTNKPANTTIAPFSAKQIPSYKSKPISQPSNQIPSYESKPTSQPSNQIPSYYTP